ncbi:MAG: helicase C-terminal domain-containing protein [Dehalococcoidia bacterium]
MPELQFSEVCVALDLEMTGLRPESDQIIEIGAVKFQGETILETFEALIDPDRDIPTFVTLLTGISNEDVKGKPKFQEVAADFVEFMGDHSIVGQNISFDLAFLAQQDVHPKNLVYDTRDLSRLIRPDATDHGLAGLAKELLVVNDDPHRALSDADTTMKVFNQLFVRFSELDSKTKYLLNSLVKKGGDDWSIGRVIGEACKLADFETVTVNDQINSIIDRIANNAKDHVAKPTTRNKPEETTNSNSGIQLSMDSLSTMENYEERPQQKEFATAAWDALTKGTNLYAEAPPGTGKSIAYLMPALRYAMETGNQVVIATANKNLQEQLSEVEIPKVLNILGLGRSDLSYLSLKGQGNYICATKFQAMMNRSDLTIDEIQFMLRINIWLTRTNAGDMGELYLNNAERSFLNQMAVNSTDHKLNCILEKDNRCFVSIARMASKASDVVVTNHALLIADSKQENGIFSDTKHLIIDEAHNIEREATTQYTEVITEGQINNIFNSFEEGGRILGILQGQANVILTNRIKEEVTVQLNTTQERSKYGLEIAGHFFDSLSTLEASIRKASDGGENVTRIPQSMGDEESWSMVNESLMNLKEILSSFKHTLENLGSFLIDENNTQVELILNNQISRIDSFLERLEMIFDKDNENRITWISRNNDSSVGRSVYYAPLDVSKVLYDNLFDKQQSIILCSGTMTADNSFEYIKSRLGLDQAEEIILGSPFELESAIQVIVPEDMPTPDQSTYDKAVADLISSISKKADGGVLVLFTSHGAIRRAYNQVKIELKELDINLMAQGIDGPPDRLVAMTKQTPRSVIFGAASFWEGVDLPGDLLKVLIIPRLPFAVPSDPIVAARSETYVSPFMEYTLPASILRFRQGIGRLIRTSSDSGIIVLLDSRLLNRRYGTMYLDSLPTTNLVTPQIGLVPEAISNWFSSK